MKVFVAIITTVSLDTYAWVYYKKPTRKQVIKRLCEHEGAEDYTVYHSYTDVVIEETEII
jgi:hypothetical protein